MKRFILLTAVILSWALPALAQDKPRVRLADSGGVLLDGQPFLPIFVWAQPSSTLEFHKALGINTMHPGESNDKDPTKAYLDKAQKNGMLALLNLESLNDETKSHPAVLAWTVEHEPDMAQKPAYAPDLSGDAAIIWIEAESPKESTLRRAGWLDSKLPQLSGERWLTSDGNGLGQASYEFEAKKAGKCNLFFREFNKAWCNPTIWSLNGAAEQSTPRSLKSADVVDLGSGRGVGWTLYGPVELKEGKNTLVLKVAPGRTAGGADKEPIKEAIWAVDAICLTTAEKYPPPKASDPLPTRLPEVEKANYEKVKKAAPDALTWNILSSQFYGPYQKESRLPVKYYEGFLKWTDITSFDHYPVTGWNQPGRLPEVGLATRQLASMARKGQPVWTIVEASDQELSWTSPETKGPTGPQMRAEVWMAVASGAKGIGYFTIAFGRGKKFQWNNLTDEVQAEMKRTNAELTELAAPIVMGDTEKKLTVTGDDTKEPSAAGHAIQAIRKEYKGKTYVIAVNVTTATAKPTFKLEAVTAKKAAVWKQDRTLDVADGAFADELKPLEVRVYVIE